MKINGSEIRDALCIAASFTAILAAWYLVSPGAPRWMAVCAPATLALALMAYAVTRTEALRGAIGRMAVKTRTRHRKDRILGYVTPEAIIKIMEAK